MMPRQPTRIISAIFEQSVFNAGILQAENSSMTRVFDKLKRSSIDQRKFAAIFLRDSSDEDVKVVGTLNYSAGKRTIFYPGLNDRVVLPSQQHGASGMLMHHISIESDFQSWHVSPFGNGKRPKIARTSEIVEGVTRLFSFSVRRPEVLELLAEKTEIRFETTESDFRRRSERLNHAVENLQHQLIDIASRPGEFYCFSFFRDIRSVPDDLNYRTAMLPESEHYELGDVENAQPGRIFDLALPDFPGKLVMTTFTLPGNLVPPAMFW